MDKLEKLPMCRICFVENVRMYVVTDKNLQEIYKRLTDTPFVAEDSRPMLTCFLCCTKLKQCWRFQRQCLEAEKLFAQMLNENYEQKLLNRRHSEFMGGFIISPIENISIGDDGQIVCQAIKQELPAACEEPFDAELKVEHQSYDFEVGSSHSDVDQQYESHTDDGELLMEFKVEKEEEYELSVKKQRVEETARTLPKKPKLDTRRAKLEDTTHAEQMNLPSSSRNNRQARTDDGELLMEFKVEKEQEYELSVKKQRVEETARTLPKKPKLDTRRAKLEDTTHAEQMNLPSSSRNNRQARTGAPDMKKTKLVIRKAKQDGTVKKNEIAVSKLYHTAKNRPSKSSMIKQSLSITSPAVNSTYIDKGISKVINSNLNTVTATKYRKNSYKDDARSKSTIQRKYFDCDVCKRSYTSKRVLVEHFRLHTGDKPYSCDICQKKFSRKSYLNTHIRTHSNEKLYKCDICQHSFARKFGLDRHLQTHTGEKRFKCDICQKRYTRKRNLNHHILKHTGEKPYKCDICQLNFNRKDVLKGHIRTHTGEEPYKCDICQRRFTQKLNMTLHIRIHTGEKPYQCDKCQRRFVCKRNLTNHIQRHTGEKPYECDRIMPA